MLDPVKPLTCVTPKRAAALAVSMTFWAARRRTPSGSPSPHTSGGSVACDGRWGLRLVGPADPADGAVFGPARLRRYADGLGRDVGRHLPCPGPGAGRS